MSDILCIYYSRTGNTKKAMEEIAAALDAELAELHGLLQGTVRASARIRSFPSQCGRSYR